MQRPEVRFIRGKARFQRRRPAKVVDQTPQPKREIVIAAATMEEYSRFSRTMPKMKIVLDMPVEQMTLFSTRDFIDV